MKIFKFLALLLLCNSISAQEIIVTKSDTLKVAEGSILVMNSGKKLIYKKSADSKPQKIKIKDIISARFNDRRFVTYMYENKVHGGFLLTENGNSKLIALTSKRTVNKGGFDVPYMRYELSIVRDGQVKQLVFTDVNNARNSELRADAMQMIEQNFTECTPIITRLKSFETNKKDIENAAITGFLENPYFTSCD